LRSFLIPISLGWRNELQALFYNLFALETWMAPAPPGAGGGAVPIDSVSVLKPEVNCIILLPVEQWNH
jgi:hypothetical protein